MSGRIPHGNDCGARHEFDGEVCGCILEPGHIDPANQVMHECSCGRRWGTVKVTVEEPRA